MCGYNRLERFSESGWVDTEGSLLMNGCVGIFGRWLGHHFEARYSVVETPGPWSTGNVEFNAHGPQFRTLIAQMLQPLETRTYHGDVCRRCGEVRNVP